MRTKASLEGYLLIDNRGAPGLSWADASKSGKNPDDIAGIGVSGRFECKTLTCSHCHTQLIHNPFRTRERAYCRKCDHYLCDQCEVARVASGYECRPLKKVLAEMQAAAERAIANANTGTFGLRYTPRPPALPNLTV